MSRAADPSTTTPLSFRIGHDAVAGEVAAAMTCILQEIDAVLVPIIGVRGVNALFRRSVHLACASQGWLLAGQDGPSAMIASLADRSDADAAAGAEAYLRAFYDLLVDLIGSALTERLLTAVWVAAPVRSMPRVSQ